MGCLGCSQGSLSKRLQVLIRWSRASVKKKKKKHSLHLFVKSCKLRVQIGRFITFWIFFLSEIRFSSDILFSLSLPGRISRITVTFIKTK